MKMAENAGRFPDPHEFEVPSELEGWEEMYPSHHLFSEDRADWEKAQFWYQDKIHAPEAGTGNRPANGGMLHVHLRHSTAAGRNHR
jgi:hypothetical protein